MPITGTKPRILAEYDYRDETGELLYQVVRMEPKDFRQRRPERSGGWSWSIGDVRRVLFRLPELTLAPQEAPVFIVEGEKDVENLRSLGLVATTNAGGAGKWRPEYNEPFRGRRVVIIADNDDPGRAHAEKVRTALTGVADSVTVVELQGLPLKGDASDWLASGHTADELRALAKAALGAEPLATARPAKHEEARLTPEAAKWPELPVGAFYGPLGEAARAIEPLTEADPTAILMQLLVAFGNAVGRGPRIVSGAIRQWANLFCVVVGKSSKARKGTSWSNALEIIRPADEAWAKDRIKSGLSSGEGVIHSVRDALIIQEAVREGGKKTGRVLEYQDVEEDPGVADKRLLVVEAEFARTLRMVGRRESVLSAILRDSWDTGKLEALTRQPYKATGAHVSIVAHITKDELRRELSNCDSVNGFANRFLWCCARRSKELPFGDRGVDEATSGIAGHLATAVRQARALGEDFAVALDGPSRDRWSAVYSQLSSDRPGLAGSVLNRAEAQVLRLALVYALADSSTAVALPHLEAALVLWRYAEESARHIFGTALGDSVADEILRVLRDAGEIGMTRNDLCDLFGRNLQAARVTEALGALVEHQLARESREHPPGGRGRPTERWFAIPIRDERNEINELSHPAAAPRAINLVNLVNLVPDRISNGASGAGSPLADDGSAANEVLL